MLFFQLLFRVIIVLLIGLYCNIIHAQTGIAFTYPLIAKDPGHLKGYRGALWYQPSSLSWQHVKIYFDVSAGHWWVSHATANRQINIYSFAPLLRYYFSQNASISPFIDLIIGASYLTRTRIADRNLGIHFSFQDQMGVGATLGKKQQFSISLSAMHYSNCSMSSTNAGITIPLLITISYGF